MDNGTTGIRVVVRNAEGCLVDGCCEAVKADNSLVVEAIAVRKGLKVAIEKKYQKVVLEMDSRVVHYEVMKKKKARHWKIWPIFKECCAKFQKKNFMLLKEMLIWLQIG